MASPALSLVPKRMSLFELVRDVEGIADLVDALDRDGELTPELEAELQAELIKAVAGTKDKIDRTTSVLASFEAAEAAALAEAERLKARAARIARQRQYLETTVIAVLTASNLQKIDGNTSTVALRKCPPTVIVDDESRIPVDFLDWPDPPPPPDPRPDKKLIAAALKRDPASVPGCRLHVGVRLVRS